ncbi:MAG: GNAT family N-acetyltransferase [Deltaproteobacteria bacterium]|nr:GNAT family N-acetyltransferase [Deltaproteobacteria bacterium]
MPKFKIRTCTQEDIEFLVETLRKSFRDVADRFGLTPENAPRHPSNCTADWIKTDMERGAIYFALENEKGIAGCVACEQAHPRTCYLERLAVLPDQRKQGCGKALVDRALSKAEELGADFVNIGIIAKHTELKDWYAKLGFVEGESKEFPHLPFRVTFMSYKL